MELQKAREAVIEAGKKLVETGLIARTWGNVSVRVSADEFLITPTGRAYDSLTPEDIVAVNIADLSYTGPIKPSSEKGVHAEVYKLKPEANFVIHTHQANASVASALGRGVDVPGESARRLIGERVELAAYGLPGTKKLRRGVADALRRSGGKAVLMAHHGALCFGACPEEAFAVALALEEECMRVLAAVGEPGPLGAELLSSRRLGGAFALRVDGNEITVGLATGRALDSAVPLPPEAQLHRAIYNARADVNVILCSVLPHIVAASKLGITIKPLLDDFAQLIGNSAVNATWDAGRAGSAQKIVRALRGRNAVLVAGSGALCCADNDADAAAVEMVLDKGCKAFLSARANGKVSPIAPFECALMRFVYRNKYSKMDVRNKRK